MVEMAQPADGTEEHLADKKIKGQGMNLDRDDEIYLNTEKKDGKWRYYNIEGKLIAETHAPGEVNADILSQWGNAVRARTKREHNFGTERSKKPEGVTSGGIALPDGVDVADVESAAQTPESNSGHVSPNPTVDDDPDNYVANKISAAESRVKAAKIKQLELLEQLKEVEGDVEAATAEVGKWKRMEAAINDED